MKNKELKITIRVDAKTKKVSTVKNSFEDLDHQVTQAQKSADSFKSQLLGFATVATAIYGIANAFQAVRGQAIEFVSTAAQFEKFESTLKSIQGSSTAAATSMQWIKQFATDTPFQIATVTEAFVKMKAYGLDPTDGTLRTLGDASSAMGKGIIDAVEAMADAVTGENERLKEFGIKASAQGDNIAYSWSDSSGKARNIVIKNNRDIIQSTLNAIFNEKYTGAMAEQSTTWNGLVSNMQDKWTNFKNDMMGAGTFDYLKASLMEVSALSSEMFSGGLTHSKEFTKFVVGGIKSIITAVGASYDIWTGIKAVWQSLQVGFYSLVVAVGEGINGMAQGWEAFKVAAQNSWKAFIDSVSKGFVDFVNYILSGINKIVNGFLSLGSGALDMMGIDISPVNLQMDAYTSSIETATMKTGDLINMDWANNKLTESASAVNASMDSIISETGSQRAAEAIANIEANMVQLNATTTAGNVDKDLAKKKLDALGAGYGHLSKAATKAGSAGKKAAKGTSKSAKAAAKASKEAAKAAANASKEAAAEAKKAMEEAQAQAEKFSDSFSNMFDDIFNGTDMVGSFSSLLGDIGSEFTKPLVDDISKEMSTALNSLTSGLGLFGGFAVGGLLQIGSALLGDLLGNAKVSDAQMKDAKGITTVLSDSVTNSIDAIEKNGTLELDYSKQMVDSLQTLVQMSDTAAANIGADITQSDYVGKSDPDYLGG